MPEVIVIQRQGVAFTKRADHHGSVEVPKSGTEPRGVDQEHVLCVRAVGEFNSACYYSSVDSPLCSVVNPTGGAEEFRGRHIEVDGLVDGAVKRAAFQQVLLDGWSWLDADLAELSGMS